ncbi:MAG: hypothetical protein WCQ60_01120 [bacterium]
MIATSTVLMLSPQLDTLNTSLQGINAALDHQPFWNTSLFGAILGGAFGLLPFLYLLYKDRPIIKVRVHSVFVPPPTGINQNQVRGGFSVTIANSGRRPITVKNVYLKFKDGDRLIFPDDCFIGGVSGLPRVIGEGNSHWVGILAGKIAQPFLKKQCYPVTAGFEDALGKAYKCRTSKKFWEGVFAADGKDKLDFTTPPLIK